MKRIFQLLALLVVFAFGLTACDEGNPDGSSILPGTGEQAAQPGEPSPDNRNNNFNQNDNHNRNQNDNFNRNNNRNQNDNFNRNDNFNHNDNQNDNTSQGLFGRDDRPRSLHRSSHLDGYTVYDQAGRSIGDIESLLIEPGSGVIGYAVLRANRDFNLERDYLVVQWEALQVRQNGDIPAEDGLRRRELVFRHDAGLAASAPSFASGDLETFERSGWDQNVGGYWNQHGAGIPVTGEEGRRLVRIDPGNIDLVDANGDRLGVVEDLVLNPYEGRVTHAAVQSGNVFNREYTLVPFELLHWDLDNRRFVAGFNRLDDYPRYRDLDEIPDPSHAPQQPQQPPPPHQPPPPAASGTIEITDNNQARTIDCTGAAVVVRSNNNDITLNGNCSSLTVRGNNNFITLGSGIPVTNTGNNNVITNR
jgi:sporulation protein YlmC with PRC-barrel domain